MGKPKAKFSGKDLVRSVEEIMRAPEHAEGMSISELAAATGHIDKWVRDRLNKLRADGKLEVGRGYRQALDGVMRPVPVYRLKG